jgi:glutamate-1-semialdehyde 2,1-aminomutase
MATMDDHFDSIARTYRRRTRRSAQLHERASRVLPGGDTRSVTTFDPYPTYVETGEGSTLVDVDDNRYLDVLNNYTSLIHGHAHPIVTRAVQEQVARGMAFAAPHELQSRLAELISDRVASVEQVRFCNSGTEAVMTALQAARAQTGRQVIAKMEGGYHGSYDHVRVASRLRTGQALTAAEATAGLSSAVESEVLVLPFNDIEASTGLLRSHADDIAAIIVEPILGSSGMIRADDEYLRALRSLASETGALLIFDEVMTFRLHPGGYQAIVGVRPDVTIFGKIIGGGLPIGAFGGAADVMEQFAPAPKGSMTHSGTFNGHPAVMAGGIATLDLLGATEIADLNGLGDRVRDCLNECFRELDLNAVATGYGSLLDVHFGTTSVSNVRDAQAGPADLSAAIHLQLMNSGVFIAPRGMMNLSTAVSSADAKRLVQAWHDTLQLLLPVIEDSYPSLLASRPPAAVAERAR